MALFLALFLLTIVVNNPVVLLSLASPHLQGGQALIAEITEATNDLLETGAKVNLQPPGEKDSENTTRAHSLARDGTVENSEVNPPRWAQSPAPGVGVAMGSGEC